MFHVIPGLIPMTTIMLYAHLDAVREPSRGEPEETVLATVVVDIAPTLRKTSRSNPGHPPCIISHTKRRPSLEMIRSMDYQND